VYAGGSRLKRPHTERFKSNREGNGFFTMEENIILNRGDEYKFSPYKKGEIEIRSIPLGASVYIDEQYKGHAPVKIK
jgi:hypothetical protein